MAMIKSLGASTLCSIIVCLHMVVFTNGNNQTALLNALFANYHKEVRPVCGSDVPINVSVGIAVRQIIELDEPKQILTLNAWLRLKWYDCQLSWNASDYGGIDSLILPFSKVWTPDITLYDKTSSSSAAEELVGLKDYRPRIFSTGDVQYNFPTVISSLCKVDVSYFPFDTQRCPLPFGSWAYHGLQINLLNRSHSGDLSTFKQNSEWDLVSLPLVRHVAYYSCCPEPYPDVTFYVTLRRKPLFYLLNLIFPCILITTVAMLGFLLPPDSGEKVSLEITVLLSLAVFLLVVSETLPPTSDNFPLIGIYFCLSMMLVTFSTVLTVIVLNVHFKGLQGTKVPVWFSKICLGPIARVMCVSHESSVHPLKAFVKHSTPLGATFLDNQMNGIKILQNGSDVRDMPRLVTTDPETGDDTTGASPMMRVLNEQLTLLKTMDKRYAHKYRHESLQEEWKHIAIVMDRLFFVLFFILSLVITLAILLQSIHGDG